MSISPGSRSASPAPKGPVLEDVRDGIATAPELAARKRQELVSALNTLAKAMGRRLEEIPAHPGYLRKAIRNLTPAMAGVSQSRWSNVISLTRFALKHAGLAHVPGRYREPLSPEWEEIFSQLPDARERYAISRLAHYCTDLGIAPNQVCGDVLEKFLRDCNDAGLVKKPRDVHRNACIAWNKASQAIAGWPKQRLTVPNYLDTYIVRWDSFPKSLTDEIDRYRNHLSGKDLFAEGPSLKPGSVKTRIRQLHEYLSAVIRHGRDPQTIRGLADAVKPEIVEEGMRFYLARSGGKPMKHAFDIMCMLTALARHWVDVPEPHLAKLKFFKSRMKPKQTGMTEKNKQCLRQFDDEDLVRTFLTLPQRIFKELVKEQKITYRHALKAQTAIAIEIVTRFPVRIENLASLELGRHVVRPRPGVMHVTIPGHEVKNENDADTELSGETVRLVSIYLTRYRPLLLREPSDHLFPGIRGGAKSQGQLRNQISRCLRRECGLKMTPHQFRHFAGKLILSERPGDYGLVKLVVGHKSVQTTEKFYCGLETGPAMEEFEKIVLKAAGESQSGTPRRDRKTAA